MSPNQTASTDTETTETAWAEGFASSARWLASLAAAFEPEPGEAGEAADADYATQALFDYYCRF